MKELYIIYGFGTDCGEFYSDALFFLENREEAKKLLARLIEARNKKCESIGVNITKEMREGTEKYPDGVMDFKIVTTSILDSADEINNSMYYDLIKWVIE